MRINIECGGDIRQDYVNINTVPVDVPNPADGAPPYDFRVGDFRNLDWVALDGSAEELVAVNVIPKLSPMEAADALKNWQKKLTEHGRLVIVNPDIRMVARELHVSNIRLQDAHVTIFGQNYENRSIIDMQVMEEALRALGFNIIEQHLIRHQLCHKYVVGRIVNHG